MAVVGRFAAVACVAFLFGACASPPVPPHGSSPPGPRTDEWFQKLIWFQKEGATYVQRRPGTSEVLTPEPIHLGLEEVLLTAAKPLSPVSESMAVFVALGMPTDYVKSRLLSPEGGSILPEVSVQICTADMKCFAATSSGQYLTEGEYGIEFGFDSSVVKSRSFSAVRIRAGESLDGVTAHWTDWGPDDG